MEKLEEILSLLAVTGGFVAVVFIIARYNFMIKKVMIEKGMHTPKTTTKARYLDLGCIIIGLGAGFLVSSIYTEMRLTEDTTDLLVWGTIAIFGGISLVVAHYLRKRQER